MIRATTAPRLLINPEEEEEEKTNRKMRLDVVDDGHVCYDAK